MDDSFSYGKPAKGMQIRLGGRRKSPKPAKAMPVATESGHASAEPAHQAIEPVAAPPRSRRLPVSKPVLVLAAVAVVAAIGFELFQVTKSGGEALTNNVKTDLRQGDLAKDAAAKSTLSTTLTAAKEAFVESGSYANVGPSQLSATEPSLHYVPGSQPSTGTNVVSVSSTPTEFGAAVLSASGTCFYLHDTQTGGTKYGTGSTCTGVAALRAEGASF